MCPECGADVRTAGVCVGPRVHLALKLIGAVTMAACLAILLGSLIGMWLLTSQRTMAAWHMKDAGGAYQLDLRTYNERIRLPRRDDHFTTITIDPANSFGGLVIGFDGFSWRDVEPAPGLSRESWRRISIGPGDPLPSPQEIADTIMQAVAPKAAPLAQAQAAWLHQQIVAMRSVPPNAVGVTAPTNLYTFSGSGSGSGTGFSRYGNTLLVALLIASLLITPVVVWRTHRPGWRPVVEGEWERTGGTPPAAAQQLAT